MKKKWLVPVLIAVLFVGILGIAFLATKDESVTKFWFEEEINVTDGVADITEHTIPFTLAEDDTYVVNVKWTAEKTGMISGAVLYDAEDKIRLYCTGDTVDVESAELELEAGDYYVTYMYFTNAEAFEEFVMAVDTTLPEDAEAYEYAENESYTMTYHFDIKYASSIAYRMGYLVGILAGVLVGLIAVAVCFEYVKIRKKGSNFEYDERQQLARGNGFKYAYVTGIVMDSPAMKAGIQRGDIITAIDGIAIPSYTQYVEVLSDYEPEETINVKINRQGAEEYSEIEIPIILGKRRR